MLRLGLFPHSLGRRDLILRDLDGHAELLAHSGDATAALTLLGRLLAEPSGAPTDLAGLYPTWRDRALAALFTREFGDRVDSEGDCRACGQGFAFGFSLDEILTAQDQAAAASGLSLDEEGRWPLQGGGWLRPPTLGDLAAYPDPDALVTALSSGVDRAVVEAQLELGAPVLAVDIGTECPHCGAPTSLGFEIGRYVVECLAGERPMLLRETHLIASAYGWSYAAIMDLRRADRRSYAHLIVSEREAAMPRRAA